MSHGFSQKRGRTEEDPFLRQGSSAASGASTSLGPAEPEDVDADSVAEGEPGEGQKWKVFGDKVVCCHIIS